VTLVRHVTSVVCSYLDGRAHFILFPTDKNIKISEDTRGIILLLNKSYQYKIKNKFLIKICKLEIIPNKEYLQLESIKVMYGMNCHFCRILITAELITDKSTP
jgi:hypothetical protein